MLLIGSGILLPTFDSYSDIFMTARLFIGNYTRSDFCERKNFWVDSHPKFAVASFLPILASWTFILRHWLLYEKTFSQKVKTLPLVILQIYPQWRAFRVIIAALTCENQLRVFRRNSNEEWKKRRDELDCGLRHIGEYVVSIPIFSPLFESSKFHDTDF